jgi:RNA polymerase sigma-70 factor, ECF subfamily
MPPRTERRRRPIVHGTVAAAELGELMKRYADGDADVFERLYRSMESQLYRYCLHLGGGRPEADDLFQETFLRVHRARGTFAGGNPLCWAFAIARSVKHDRMRHRRSRAEELGRVRDAVEAHVGVAAGDPESAARGRDLVAVVAVVLERISERNRSAYVLIQQQGLSIKAAAAILGTTTDTVKQRAHRACIQLRAALEAAGWTVNRAAEPIS